ncbi:hypothetical protein GOP47_0001913 [Adiantum capillus-veneris]|uniref:Uncharacterized protein n=1 Tax=Adiantum capillus-veneris TaxID=13818 RepID=A0A9D4V959_ADICA|nr:hypothetical protein GOP47_0001913 [Adiantum capillus-veneris]
MQVASLEGIWADAKAESSKRNRRRVPRRQVASLEARIWADARVEFNKTKSESSKTKSGFGSAAWDLVASGSATSWNLSALRNGGARAESSETKSESSKTKCGFGSAAWDLVPTGSSTTWDLSALHKRRLVVSAGRVPGRQVALLEERARIRNGLIEE